jgi:predicted PhzF superfamily epimerase YddE/YHI9/ribosomal protein S18 acetylase RimI-like enzyme
MTTALQEVNGKQVRFRTVRPTDIEACAAIEEASYPADEAASRSSLQYRQHHAERYFRCAVLSEQQDDDEHDEIIGYVCSTRCQQFTHGSMSSHDSAGRLLAIHSVAVAEDYRRKGIAKAMLRDYVEAIREMNSGADKPVERIVLMAKADLLLFYIDAGFSCTGPSAIVHGREQWYDMELDLQSGSPGLPCYAVDAFAVPDKAGSGNPAAVVLMETASGTKEEAVWMQRTASSFNLSETAFVWPVRGDAEGGAEEDDFEDGDGSEDRQKRELHYRIRYFTPSIEVPLCGHATLASASVIFQTRHSTCEVVFEAPRDTLRAALASSSGRQSRVKMTFPAKPAAELLEHADLLAVKNMLFAALNVDTSSILYAGLSDIGDVLIELTYESFVQIGYEGLNYAALLEWDGYTRGVIVCCENQRNDDRDGGGGGDGATSEVPDRVDFLSRFFGPKAGIDEDPVTGSAHCVLAPYFAEKLGGKAQLTGMQTSARGGLIECSLAEDGATVELTGSAITAMSGTLWL